jgi:hypothetical protein
MSCGAVGWAVTQCHKTRARLHHLRLETCDPTPTNKRGAAFPAGRTVSIHTTCFTVPLRFACKKQSESQYSPPVEKHTATRPQPQVSEPHTVVAIGPPPNTEVHTINNNKAMLRINMWRVVYGWKECPRKLYSKAGPGVDCAFLWAHTVYAVQCKPFLFGALFNLTCPLRRPHHHHPRQGLWVPQYRFLRGVQAWRSSWEHAYPLGVYQRLRFVPGA